MALRFRGKNALIIYLSSIYLSIIYLSSVSHLSIHLLFIYRSIYLSNIRRHYGLLQNKKI